MCPSTEHVERVSTTESICEQIDAAVDLSATLHRLAPELCDAFAADRITIFRTDKDRATITTVVKRGLESYKCLKLPIDDSSLAGYVAMHRKVLNVADVSDEEALAALDPPARWAGAIDQMTGYATHQLLSAPIVGANGAVLGVVQVINRLDGERFPASCETKLVALCERIAGAMQRR